MSKRGLPVNPVSSSTFQSNLTSQLPALPVWRMLGRAAARRAVPENQKMQFASSISARPDADRAVEELLAPIDQQMTPGMADVVLFFATAHYEDEFAAVLDRVQSFFSTAALIGCTAEGTLGVDREVERAPSMALLALSLPDVAVRPFHLRQRELEALDTLADWERAVGVSPENKPVFLAFADPFRFNVLGFVDLLTQVYPGAPLFGGIASAASRPGENTLLALGEQFHDGAVGVALSGKLVVHPVVSQGCRPIGRPFVITKGERNIIWELGGLPPLAQLQAVLNDLPPGDESLARESLFVGRVIDEYKETFGRGDFLIHNLMGADKGTGAIAIAGPARRGATVQFHVRDAASADEDLRESLAPYANLPIGGAMLFSCNGRGTRMWPEPHHDIRVLRETVGKVPVAGFFCGGEFGPVGPRNFVHGFTASIALIEAPETDDMP